jgi:hypothetical protein
VHHAAVTRHIGGEDGDELALQRRDFHDRKLQQWTVRWRRILSGDASGTKLFP